MDRPMSGTKINIASSSNSSNVDNEIVKKLRPLSRRGVKEIQRDNVPPQGITDDPPIRSTSVMNVQDNLRPSSSIGNRLQGTASRLASAISQQPSPSLSLNILPSRSDTQVNTTDRLVTQQGLSRARSTIGSRKGQSTRLIQDKRYYEGILQVKMRDLTNEISRLRKQVDDTNKERATFTIYDKQVKQLAKELTELQGKLADYNLCLDKLNTGANIKQIESEYQAIHASNEIEQIKLENTFGERTRIQQQVQVVEQEIEKEKHTAERMVSEMPLEMREKYANLCDSNVELQEKINGMQHELDTVIKKKNEVLDKFSEFPIKQESAQLQLKLLDLEKKRDTLVAEINNSDSQQEKYTTQVKSDKAEIASMERAMIKLQDSIEHMKKEIENIDQEIEECHSDQYRKYMELRKREETIVSFLSTFEENKSNELERIANLKTDIIKSLFVIGKHLLTIPSATTEYDLVNKELPQIDPRTTSSLELLKLQYQQRQLYYKKLEGMEIKLKTETTDLKDRIEKMRSELVVYNDLDKLREEMDKKRVQLLNKKQIFLKEQDKISEDFKQMETEHKEMQKKLKENETYTQLQALERKLAQTEQNNFALREFIADKKCETDYDEIKDKSLNAVKQYNQMLIKKYSSTINN